MTDVQVCEAMGLGVQVYGAPPAPLQWVRLKADLDREPPEGRWWRQKKWGCSLVVVRGPVTTHPAYSENPELAGVRGHANPVPVVSADYAYPPDGAQAGVSVALHEAGHALCEVLTTHGPQATRDLPLWARANYVAAHRATPRPAAEANLAEQWAEDYACWCLWQSGYDARAPWFASAEYRPVRAYLKGLLWSAGFRTFGREG